MRKRILTVVMVLLMAGAAYAAADDFGGLDKDKNGRLVQSEVENAAPGVFQKADKTRDGALDRKEFKTAGGSSLRFDEVDKDKNGRIDLDEFRAAAIARFKAIDANQDGWIDARELRSRQKPIQNPLIQFYF
jgi:Ca2+-binding EF-hand superfamily protein